jgi:hypothetical protein
MGTRRFESLALRKRPERFVMFTRFAAVIAFAAVAALPQAAAAQEWTTDARPASITTSVASATVQFVDEQRSAPLARERRNDRWTGPVLNALQAATIATQMLDVHSTATALKAGATEANPLMGGLGNNKAALIGVKAAVGAGLVYVTHQLGKENKVMAIVTSATINSAYLMIARHNYKVARSFR